ncbi:MAG: prolyl oligopeptidase family serine peptidase [Victivallales bacterium]|nr:prolyl oligopeptidase family serine peptidase [Victivallales bacterium]
MNTPRTSRVLDKLRAGKKATCFKFNLGSCRAVEMTAMAGFDAMWLCQEHVPTDYAMIDAQIMAAKIHGADSIVRVQKGCYSDYILPLEADAAGIMVPHLMSLEEAREIVHWTRFAPLGRRPLDGGNADGAIAMDTCGCQPAWAPDIYWTPQWPRLPDGGAPGWGGFDQLDEAPADQWVCQATACVLRATAVLRTLPQVDGTQVGIAGISWGGYLTLVATTVAPQGTYCFAIPVYASAGFTRFQTGILLGRPEVTAEQADEWTKRWNPLPALKRNRTPMLFLTDAEDLAFPAPSWQQTTDAVAGPVQRSMRIEFPHDHQSSFHSRTEAVFAEAMLQGKPLPVWGKPVQEGRRLACEICANGRRFRETSLFYTRAKGFWGDRRWRAVPATLRNGILSAVLPPETTAAFFGVKDTQDCQWSSDLMSNIANNE